MKNLIAKPVIKNQFWIVTNGSEKVGNVLADGSGFEVKLNGSKSHYKNTKAIERITNIKFENITNFKTDKKDIPFYDYPTTGKVYNSMLDVKRKLHLYTKAQKSKCYYAAGYYVVKQGVEEKVIFCPKYIFIQRYSYKGPYKTEHEAQNALNNI